MAKKKPDEPKKGAPEWQTTFSDLMNLLLCFFVLLFSMSSVDANKWEQIVASFNNSFSIFDGGKMSIGSGSLVGVGTSQLTNLDEYYTGLGKSDDDEGSESKDKEQDGVRTDGEKEEKSLEEQLDAANREETSKMLDNISEMTERYNLSDKLDISMDVNGKYVELIINGSILFDQGRDELKKECIPLISKVGDIMRVYDGHNIEIIGHTDNVPMRSSARFESNDILSSARAISAAQYLVNEKNIDITRLRWTGRGEYDPIASNATAEGRAKNRRVEIRIYNSFNSD